MTNAEVSVQPLRLHALDGIKAIAILLVVHYHTGSEVLSRSTDTSSDLAYAEYFLHGLCTIGVPLFFLINGYLLLNRPFQLSVHCIKTVHLYLLTLAWSFLTVVVLMGLQGNAYGLGDFFKTVFFLKPHINNHLWFLFALTSIYLLYPIIKVIHDSDNAIITLYLVFIYFAFSFGVVFLNWCFDLVMVIRGHDIKLIDGALKLHQPFNSQGITPFSGYFWTFVYFIIGGLLGKFLQIKSPPLWILYCAFVIASFCLYAFGIMVSINSNGGWFDTVFQGYSSIPSLAMTLSFFLLCMGSQTFSNFGKNKIVRSIGQNTLGIFLVHIPILHAMPPNLLSASQQEYLVPRIFVTLSVLLVSWVITLVLRRAPGLKPLFRF